MNTKVFDLIAMTMLCVVVAAVLTHVAHLIGAGEILNPNWDFAIFMLLGTAMFFMVLPFILARSIAFDHFIEPPYPVDFGICGDPYDELEIKVVAKSEALRKYAEANDLDIANLPVEECTIRDVQDYSSEQYELDYPSYHWKQPY